MMIMALVLPKPFLYFMAAATLIAATAYFVDWCSVLEARNAPVVTGIVKHRTRYSAYTISRVDFQIEIQGTSESVHARTPAYLINRVPDVVHFGYTGNPAKEVFLSEYEHYPFYPFAFFLMGGVWAIVLLRQRFYTNRRKNNIV